MVPEKVAVGTEIQKLLKGCMGRGLIFLCHRRERGKDGCRDRAIAISYRKVKTFQPIAFCFLFTRK